MPGDAPEENQPITKNDLQNMMAGLLEKANENTKRMLDDRMPEEKSEKRRKFEKVKLNSKANQQQLDYQGQVAEIFEKAENSLKKQKFDEVANLLNKGKELCFSRMKILLIADRDGWATANAYQSDDLASDEEDEKRIQKAIREAARKRRLRDSSNSAHNSNSGQSSSHHTDNNRLRQKPKIPIEELECWRCGKKGHFIASCTNPPKETLAGNPTDNTSG